MNAQFRFLGRVAAVALAVLAGPAAAMPIPPPPAPPWAAPLEHDHPLAGRIWLSEKGRLAEPLELLQAMLGADYVLLGEQHGHPDHHALQAWVVARLLDEGRRTPVAFEMFGTDQARQIARHLSRRPTDAEGLGKATDWEKTGWPAWTLYMPIAQAALDAGMPVVAANLPETEARAITRKQPIDPDRLMELGLDEPMPRGLHAALLEDIRLGHCDMLPEAALSPMAMAQRAKDGSMAAMMHRAAHATGMDGAVLITGATHARTDRGVPLALRRLDPAAAVFSLAFVEVAPDEADPAAYAARYGANGFPFDAVWFTASQPRIDHCATMAEHMRKRGERGETR